MNGWGEIDVDVDFMRNHGTFVSLLIALSASRPIKTPRKDGDDVSSQAAERREEDKHMQ